MDIQTLYVEYTILYIKTISLWLILVTKVCQVCCSQLQEFHRWKNWFSIRENEDWKKQSVHYLLVDGQQNNHRGFNILSQAITFCIVTRECQKPKGQRWFWWKERYRLLNLIQVGSRGKGLSYSPSSWREGTQLRMWKYRRYSQYFSNTDLKSNLAVLVPVHLLKTNWDNWEDNI